MSAVEHVKMIENVHHGQESVRTGGVFSRMVSLCVGLMVGQMGALHFDHFIVTGSSDVVHESCFEIWMSLDLLKGMERVLVLQT